MSEAAGAFVLAGRVLFPAYCAYFGYGHLRGSRGFVEGVRSRGRIPVPVLAGWPAGLWLLAGALSVAVGVWPDVGALMLGVFVVLTALYVHDFWHLEEDSGREAQRQLFLRNMAYLASCLVMFGTFAGLGGSLRFVLLAPLIRL
ncbi:MAG: DoxX family protein [Actinomycetota bacterium]